MSGVDDGVHPYPVSPGRRRSASKVANHTRWAHEPDRTAATAPARAAFDQRFLDEVDPNRVLPVEEREQRAAHARSAYFTRLAMKSAQTRASKKSA